MRAIQDWVASSKGLKSNQNLTEVILTKKQNGSLNRMS